MRAFQTTLKPSRSLKALSVLLHLSAVAVCLIWFYGWMMWFGLVNLRTVGAVKKIAIDRHARASGFCGDGEGQGAVLDGATMLTPYALFLQWNADGKTIRQCVTPDMADKESYRRLKVWARWCQAQDDANPI